KAVLRRRSQLSFCFTLPPPPESTLFPYTTLFRSRIENSRSGSQRINCGINAQFHNLPREHGRGIKVCKRRDRRRIGEIVGGNDVDRKSTRLNSSHVKISYAVFCLKKKNIENIITS